MRKYWRTWLLAGLMTFSTLAGAFLPGTEADPVEVVTKAPDVRSLAADWWQYFNTDDTERAARIAAFQGQLEGVVAALPSERRPAAQEAVALIAQNFAALEALRQAPLPAVFLAESDKPNYRLVELLTLAAKQRRLEQELSSDTERAEQQAGRLRSAEQELSGLKLAYLALPRDSVARLDAALDIVLRRLSSEILSEQNRRLRADLKSGQTELEAYRAEFKTARDRLVSAADDRAQFERGLSEVQHELARLSTEQRRYQLSHPPAAAGAARNDQAVQALNELSFEIRNASLKLTQQRYQQGILLVDLLAGSKPDPAQLGSQLRSGAALLEDASRRSTAWRDLLERERGLAQQTDAKPSNNASEFKLQERQRLGAADSLLLDQHRRDRNELAIMQSLLERRLDVEGGVPGQLRRTLFDWADNAWQSSRGLLSYTLFEVNETPVTPTGLIRMLVILFVAIMLSRLIRHGLTTAASKRDTLSRASVYGLNRVIHYFIIVIGLMVGLSSIGIEFTKFALFASALGVGIGFGLQNLIGNFVAGLIILFEKSLKVGDFVDLQSGVAGEVQEINMRSTLIRTTDNIDIIVPNAEFVSGRVTNWTLREAYRRVHVPFGVAYGSKKELVKKAVLEIAETIPHTLTGQSGRRADVWFVGFGDSSLNFELVVWLTPDAVKRPGKVMADYLWAIHSALEQNQIEVPFPQRDIHLRSYYGLTGDAARAAASSASEQP